MKNLSTLGLIVWMAVSTSCQKGEVLNPIKLTDQTSISTVVHDSTYYVYPDGYTATNAFMAPITLGVPVYLEAKNDLFSSFLRFVINLNFASTNSILDSHPQYLSPENVNTINIAVKSELYVTFVSQGASNKNTLAYYTYQTGKPPVSTSGGSDNGAMDKITYIFPNASLTPGNKIKLGIFSPGTSVSFVLISNGWTGNDVNITNEKFYSQDKLNPETTTSLKRHSVMLYDDIDQLFLIGFEDRNRQTGSSDNDFNDLVFYVSSNVKNSISNLNVVPVDNSRN
ncbi:DUF4114 domain-containing protein [Mucilaginibacter jinjuensis]|uniref:DUF4114 domain-containing protein n=1 Tax=Mucilaginibacter jinjuensis TaxID=1176721 RepID=A0ABY7TCX6_9SPHI|nr:DUF4114 domain-containing protein [Mucilaginibacter jinjuensis]WCT13851.1 DUF4114 domain-containing protein [Mucilaginibacter jinjuensis]